MVPANASISEILSNLCLHAKQMIYSAFFVTGDLQKVCLAKLGTYWDLNAFV